MSDRLSLPNLISQLQVTHNDDTIVSLCREVESLRRRRYYKKAIEVAQNAVELARPSHVHNAIGASLLYLALARLSSQSPDEIERATQDCDQAILRFNLEPHNSAFAQIFRAEIDQLKNLSAQSVMHLQEAAKAFDELTKNNLAHGDVERAHQYQNWRSAIQAVIVERAGKIADLKRAHVSKKQKRKRTDEHEHAKDSAPYESPIDLEIPTELLWPIPEPVQLAAMVPRQPSSASPNPHDFIEVDELFVNGRAYSIQSVNNGTLLKARPDQPYIPIPVKPNGHAGQIVLVRPTQRLEHDREIVAVMHPTLHRAWVKWEPPPLVIGGIDSREWVRMRLTEDELHEVQMLGVFEALLTPITSTIAQINDLLDCIDTLRYAEDFAGANVAFGLTDARKKLQKHCATHYGVQRIPIAVGVTPFDPNLGHSAIERVNRDDLPKGVIVKVAQDGYTRHGKIFRDAKVIVNQ